MFVRTVLQNTSKYWSTIIGRQDEKEQLDMSLADATASRRSVKTVVSKGKRSGKYKSPIQHTNFIKSKQTTMKKNTFFLIVTFLTMLILNSCKSEVENNVMEVNKQCPIELNSTCKITALEFENGIITYRFTLDEEFNNMTALSKHPSKLHVNALNAVTGSEGDVRELYELAAKEGFSIRFVYKGNNTGKEATVMLFASQIKRALNENIDAGISKLEAEINFANISMPMNLENGVVIRKIEFQDNVVCYLCDIDEEQISINLLKKNIDELKRNILLELKGMSKKDKLLFEMIREGGYLFAYKYKGTTTGKEVTLTFSNSEIAEILQ